MTDEQKKTQQEMETQWQTQQDAITLDFSKWSQQRTRAKLSNSHDLWIQQRDDVLARQQSENAELRRKYLNGLEAAKVERQTMRDAEIDLELADERRRLQNEWLANNPTQTPKDFTEKAWHLLRENLIARRELDNKEATRNSLLATGRYAL